jgi:hypothetical protein
MKSNSSKTRRKLADNLSPNYHQIITKLSPKKSSRYPADITGKRSYSGEIITADS